MSKLGINTGSSANAGDGDSLLSGAIKINSNFDELYTSLGDGSTISAPVTSIVGGTNVSVSSSTGNVTISATASGGGISGINIQDEGSALSTTATALNFVGNGVVASGTGTTKTITISGSGGGSGIDVQDEGSALSTTATTLNFVGGGVVASGTGATKTITISGGGGSGVGTENVRTDSLVVSGVTTCTGGIIVPNNQPVTIGDITIENRTSPATGSLIETGNDLLLSQARLLVNNQPNDANMIIATQGASVELYYGGSKKLETSGAGVTITGSKSFFTSAESNSPATLQIETGSAGVGNTIRSSNNLDLRTNGSAFSVNLDNTSAILAGGTGASQYVSLYGQGSEKLKTIGTGISVTGNVTCSNIDSTNLDTGTGFLTLGNSSSAFDIRFSPSTGASPAIRYSVANQISIYNRYNGGANLLEDVRFDTSNTYFKNITPFSDSTYNLGTNTNRWLTSYVDTSYARNVNADAAQVGAGLNLQYQNNASTILHNSTLGQFNIQSVSGVNIKPGPSHFSVYSSDDVLRFKVIPDGANLYGNINVGLGTNVSGFTSTNTVNTPALTLSHNNPTVVNTSGTTGEIKQIGGAPFFYDGAVWREFVLATGTPVTRVEDSDWDNVMLRLDFEDNTTNIADIENIKVLGSGQDQKPDNTQSSTVELVGSPVKYGSKSLRFSGADAPNCFDWINRITGQNDALYDFEGPWTIELWLYISDLPDSGVINPIVSQYTITNTPTNDWALLLQKNDSTGRYEFKWYNLNNTSSYTDTTPGRVLESVLGNSLENQWNHIALVRDGSDSSMHFYLNGTEASETSNNNIIDPNLQWGGTSSYLSFGYHFKMANSINHYTEMVIDDVRISKAVRYTSNFTAPTAALPIAGTASTVYTPPGSKQGEIALGNSPTWTGMSGVTASKIDSGHYRATFSSSFGSGSDYVITTSMNDYTPSTTAVGIGVTRYAGYADFIVTRVSDSAKIDSGSLAINLMKK